MGTNNIVLLSAINVMFPLRGLEKKSSVYPSRGGSNSTARPSILKIYKNGWVNFPSLFMMHWRFPWSRGGNSFNSSWPLEVARSRPGRPDLGRHDLRDFPSFYLLSATCHDEARFPPSAMSKSHDIRSKYCNKKGEFHSNSMKYLRVIS